MAKTHKTFLHRVVQDLLGSSVPLGDQLLVLPSRRSITFFKKELAQCIDGPVILPRILTMDELAKSISGLEKLDPISTRLELYDSYCEVYADAEPYGKFEAWIGAILRDFNTIDTYCIDAKRLYTDLREFKEIAEWSFALDDLSEDQGEFNVFWKRMGLLYEAFGQRLKKRGRAYSGAILRSASEQVASSALIASTARVTVAGFNALSPSEIRILQGIEQQSRLRVLWDDAPFYTNNERDPAGHFMRRWKEMSWGQAFNEDNGPRKEIYLSGHPHSVSLSRWAGAILEQHADQEEDIALILADEDLLSPVLHELPAALKAVNITIGLGFKDTSVFHFLKQYIEVHVKAEAYREARGDWAVNHGDILAWADLAHRFHIIPNRELEGLRRAVHADGVAFFQEGDLKELLGANLCLKLGLGPLPVDEVMAKLRHMLENLTARDQLQEAIASRLAELLAEGLGHVSRYAFVSGLDQIWKTIRSSLQNERISFVGEPLKGLQVMGLLETRALDFDTVILLGLNEGKLPKAQRFDTFLPHDIRSHYGLPTQKEEEAVFAYYFYRSIQGARKVYLGYTSVRDAMGAGEPSRFIMQLESGLVQAHGLDAELKRLDHALGTSEVRPPDMGLDKDDVVRRQILNWLTKRGLSVSRLNDYNRCPLDFYFTAVLGLGEIDSPQEEIGASELGDLVHRALELSFEPFVEEKKVLDLQSMEGLDMRANAHLDELLNEKGYTARVKVGESALVVEVARHMIAAFFQKEKKRLAHQQVLVIAQEVGEKFSHTLEIDGQKHALIFKSKIDRVEQQNGQTYLLDYKTGKVDPGDVKLNKLAADAIFKVDRSKALQLLYYSWHYWRMHDVIAQPGIITMSSGQSEPLMFSIGGASVTRADLGVFEELLMDRVREMLAPGHLQHIIRRFNYCSYCVR